MGIPVDAGRVPLLRDIGALLLALSFGLMVLVEPVEAAPKQEVAVEPDGADAEAGVQVPRNGRTKRGYKLSKSASETAEPPTQVFANLIGARIDNPDAAGGEMPNVDSQSREGRSLPQQSEENSGFDLQHADSPESPRELSGCLLKVAGGVLALFGGVFTGLNAVPFDAWRLQHPMKSKGSFVFPQAVGIWLMSTVIFAGGALMQRALAKEWPPQPIIMPAFASGCLWAIGFVFMCFAIDGIGFTAAYTLDAIGPVFIASIISVLWYKEIKGKGQLRLFFVCCLIQAIGVVLIAIGT